MLKDAPHSGNICILSWKTISYWGGTAKAGTLAVLLVSGMGRRGFDAFKAALEPYHFKPVLFFGSKKSKKNSGFVTLNRAARLRSKWSPAIIRFRPLEQ